MTDAVCRSCARPLAGRDGRAGRSSVYCSAACRQKAYRERRAAPDGTVRGLIEDVGRQVEALVPQPPSVFYAGVSDLAASVGRLRRIARVARDTAQDDSVTRTAVTKEAGSPSPAVRPATGDAAAPHTTGPRTGDPHPPAPRTGDPHPSAPRTAPDETSRTRDSVTGDSVPRAAVPRDSAARDSVTRAAVTHDSVPQDTVTQDTVTQDSRTQTPQEQVRLGESDFAALVEPYRRELRVHCYRMAGSYDDAEDLVQETFLRAWRARDGFAGRASVRTWLYRIATNTCLDFQRRTARRPRRYEPLPGMNHGSAEPPARITWLQPYPDEELPSADEQPDALAVSRETMELVLLAAIQHLPPRQRAVLLLRDLVGLSAVETAQALEMTPASVNSGLQRARPALRDRMPRRRSDWTAEADARERAVLGRYMAAAESLDLGAFTDLLSEDIRLTMPPNPYWFVGRAAITEFLSISLDPASPLFLGHWRHLPARANGQLAAGGYVRRPGTTVYRAQVLDVLRIEGDRVVEITSFEPHLFPAFGLPLRLPADR
ncbi:RNA polymerase subunit sigma-70 [Streptomyces sp. NPDC001083]|uniref:RNA polymerase subunit sigma-70 n=1 Tax=Streptomyces sp. NPDC001083 TaxID=3364545 RepID=UPI00369B6B42